MGITAMPFAGNFDGNTANGDEVGLLTGTSGSWIPTTIIRWTRRSRAR